MTATISEDARARDQVVRVGRSLSDRCLTCGSTGDISVRVSSGDLPMTPTYASLGDLDPEQSSRVGQDRANLTGDPPTKEHFLHRCMYCDDDRGAVVHLHSTYAVAVSILDDVDPKDVIPPLTACYVMRIGTSKLVAFHPCGDAALAEAVRLRTEHSHAVLASHGPVVAGRSLLDAQDAADELEETARLHLVTLGRKVRPLASADRSALRGVDRLC